jgi:hypothetical protein
MNDLQVEDILAVLELGSNRGFRVVLDLLRTQVDSIEHEIQGADSDASEKRLVSSWRAKREILHWLENLPESLKMDLALLTEAENLDAEQNYRKDLQLNW